MSRQVEIGVDIGGTFTDVVLIDDTGSLQHAKVPTTSDRVDAVLVAIRKVLNSSGSEPGEIARFVHGSTVATNAVLERKGAVVGILTTHGFEDTLEIGRQKRSDMYALAPGRETPVFLAPGRRRVGIRGRIGSDGSIIESLDEVGVRRAVEVLVVREGVEAIAVCLLFSFFNPSHEQRVREIVHEVAPDLHVSLSCEVDPEVREYERMVVTAFDAYLSGVVNRYIERLEGGLASEAITPKLQILQSRGGIMNAEKVANRPVTMLLSGLAAGVIGGTHAARQSGAQDVITFDMGGTSCDVALVHESKPLIANKGSIDGFPLRIPMVDVNTIGAGGGSIAWVDGAGGLRVGPQSAGSEPGPACYDRGGEAATVTDASLILGYLNPDFFAGGELQLNRARAEDAVGAVANRLRLDLTETARGIHEIVNARMADEIKMVSIRRGYDHRKFSLVAFGGAGPTHGGALLSDLGIPTMIVPSVPGVLSALGLLMADVEHDQVAAVGTRLRDLGDAAVRNLLEGLNREGEQKMIRDGIAPEEVTITEFADLRYSGQSYDITVPLSAAGGEHVVESAEASFHTAYERLYGHSNPAAPVELMSLRTVHRLPVQRKVLPYQASGLPSTNEPTEREAFFAGAGGYVTTPVYRRHALVAGQEMNGPVIIEQADTTTVVGPGQGLHVAADGSMVVRSA